MNYEKFKNFFEPGWGDKLKPFIESEACDKIYAELKKKSREGRTILPDSSNVWQVFKECPYDDLKCVLLLQDPYPWIKGGTIVGNGVAMDCRNTGKLQPSLSIFYDGIQEDLYTPGTKIDKSPSLRYLSEQGVMLLNTSLTVELNKPSSHYEMWKPFMEYLFQEVFEKYNNGLIFILMGKSSKSYERLINPMQHYILECEHPAAAAHNGSIWKHEKVFSKANRILKENNGGGSRINWVEVFAYDDLPF